MARLEKQEDAEEESWEDDADGNEDTDYMWVSLESDWVLTRKKSKIERCKERRGWEWQG